MPLSARRERRIYTTRGRRGQAVMVRTFVRGAAGEMEPTGAPFFVFDREAPEMLVALGEAVAAIGGATAGRATALEHGAQPRQSRADDRVTVRFR